jgi:hypothetical protein
MITIIPDQEPPADGTPADPDEMCDACAGHPGDRNRQLFCWLCDGHEGPHHDKVDHVMWTGAAAQPSGPVMELNARIVAAAAVLGDYKAAVASAPVTSPPGREWMLRLADVLEGLLGALNDGEHGQGDELDGLEPYCTECGAWCGIFRGHGGGWHHWRGQGTAASPVELYDAGHEPVVAWCAPPGRSLAPADVAVLCQALADAVAHVEDLDQDQADAYAALGRQLQPEAGQ